MTGQDQNPPEGGTPPPAGETPPAPLPELEKKQRKSLAARFRNYLLTGVLVTAPAAITFYVAFILISFIDDKVTKFIPAQYNPETYLPYGVPGLGVVILITGLILIGMFAAGFIGRALVRFWDGLLTATPVVSSIYSVFKQIFETLFSNKSQAFRQVVLVEYPRRELWVIGFVTGTAPKEVVGMTGTEIVNVFIPTIPNPTSGFFLFFPKKDVRPLSMSVEDAWKLVISAGMVTPGEGKKSALKKE